LEAVSPLEDLPGEERPLPTISRYRLSDGKLTDVFYPCGRYAGLTHMEVEGDMLFYGIEDEIVALRLDSGRLVQTFRIGVPLNDFRLRWERNGVVRAFVSSYVYSNLQIYELQVGSKDPKRW
jgi:hypothetical protein